MKTYLKYYFLTIIRDYQFSRISKERFKLCALRFKRITDLKDHSRS